jgi:Dockerin type I domain/PEP-CTERM motif
VFKFRVNALAGNNSFTNHALVLGGIRFDNTGGLANITGEVTNRFGGDLGSTLVFADAKSNSTTSLDTLDFAPQSEVSVISNVFIQGLSTTDAINLASFTQSFSQTGPAVLPGDFNHDKAVDTADIQAMLTALTDLKAYQAAHGLSDDALVLLGDLNGDGKIDNTDLQSLITLVANNFGGGSSLATVPEPATLTLSVIGLSVFAIRRWRTHSAH